MSADMDESTSRNRRGGAVRITQLFRFFVVISLILAIGTPAFGVIEIESIEFGFEGFYKRGRWVPLQLLVVSENEHDSFVGELEVTVTNLFSATTIQTYSTPVSLTRTDRRRFNLHVFQPGTSTKLMLRIVHHEGRVRVEREIIPDLPKEPKDLFILALTPPGYDVLDDWHGEQIDASTETRAFVLHPASQKHLPLDWIGYHSIDLVAIHGVSLATNYISTRQQASLLDWVCNGGTLLISGGSNLQHLRDSFLEPILPAYLGELKTAMQLPESVTAMKWHLDFPINLIDFKLKDNAQILGIEGVYVTDRPDHPMLVLQRSFGSGRIVCLAFEFDDFTSFQSQEDKQFWTQVLKTVGKSPRHLDDRYELYQRDAEKIHEVLKSLPLARVPLFRILPLFLLACLLSIGGFTWWMGKNTGRIRHYWIGAFLITLFFSCTAIFPRHLLSTPVSVSRYSILSVYSENSRAYLQTYIGAIASTNSKSSIQFDNATYIRPLRPTSTPPLHVVDSKPTRTCEAELSAWQTRTYLVESFFDLPPTQNAPEWMSTSQDGKNPTRLTHHLPGTLENAGIVYNGEYLHMGMIPPDTSVHLNGDFAPIARFPAQEELTGIRQKFAQILASEGVLQHFAEDAVPKLVGWMNHPFLPMELNQPVDVVDETFVIIYLGGNVISTE